METVIKGDTIMNQTHSLVFFWGLSVWAALQRMILDSMLTLRLATSPWIKPKSHIRLPPELIDIIISHLSDDPKSLETCSHVCRSWLPASRYHLLRTVSLRLPISGESLEYLKASVDILIPYVHHLYIQGPDFGTFMDPLVLEQFLQSLTPFSKVETLRLCNLDIRDFYSALVPIASVLTLSHLELHDIVFYDINEMTHFVSHFRQLKRLDICPQFRKISQLASTAPRLPTSVDSVGYTVGITGEENEVCDWIALSKEQIRFLDLGVYSAFAEYGYDVILGQLLEDLGPYLHRVEVSFIDGQLMQGGPRKREFKLSHDIQLRSVLAQLSQTLGYQPLSNILSLAFAPISNIVIKVPEPEALYAEDWSEVDDLLEGPRFANLDNVSFQLPGTPLEQSHHKTHLERSLGKCYTKGILRTNNKTL